MPKLKSSLKIATLVAYFLGSQIGFARHQTKTDDRSSQLLKDLEIAYSYTAEIAYVKPSKEIVEVWEINRRAKNKVAYASANYFLHELNVLSAELGDSPTSEVSSARVRRALNSLSKNIGEIVKTYSTDTERVVAVLEGNYINFYRISKTPWFLSPSEGDKANAVSKESVFGGETSNLFYLTPSAIKTNAHSQLEYFVTKSQTKPSIGRKALSSLSRLEQECQDRAAYEFLKTINENAKLHDYLFKQGNMSGVIFNLVVESAESGSLLDSQESLTSGLLEVHESSGQFVVTAKYLRTSQQCVYLPATVLAPLLNGLENE